MSDIDFQNGFLCGMATKGLVRSGEQYKPIVWNDSGVYTYFYIDFRRSMEEFSLGMLTQSVIVHDSSQLTITDFEAVSASVYKIYCNISGKTHGVTVLNKKTTLLYFKSGEIVPAFSTHFYVAGLASYFDMKYIYEETVLAQYEPASVEETVDEFLLWTAIDGCSYSDSATFAPYEFVTPPTESVTIALT